MGVFMSGMDFGIALFNIVVLLTGGLLIYHGELDPIVLITFMLYVSSFTSPIKSWPTLLSSMCWAWRALPVFWRSWIQSRILRISPALWPCPG